MGKRSSFPTKWRDLLPVHPAAELFPMMSPDELRELGEDIKKHKLHEPIMLWFPDPESNKPELLDGRNRMDAMEAAGISVVRDEWRGGGIHQLLVDYIGVYPPADPYAYVISRNYRRRHLTAEQKRELIAKLLKAKPDQSNRQVAKTIKASHHTVKAVRAGLESTGQIAQLEKTTGKDGKARKPPTKGPAVTAPVERAVARSEASQRPQAGNGVDPALSADRRRAEALADEQSQNTGYDPKPAAPAKSEPVGRSPVRYSEVGATSVTPQNATIEQLLEPVRDRVKEAILLIDAGRLAELIDRLHTMLDIEAAAHVELLKAPNGRTKMQSLAATILEENQ